MRIHFFLNRKIPSKKKLLAFAKNICRRVKKLQKDKEICIAFISDHQIRKLNKTFFHKNTATDVIAFPYGNTSFSNRQNAPPHHTPRLLRIHPSPEGNPLPSRGNKGVVPAKPGSGGEGLPFGDIFISLDTAQKQARAGKHRLSQELALLICHGLLHLVGFEDSMPLKKRKMFQMQKKLFWALAPDLAPPDILK